MFLNIYSLIKPHFPDNDKALLLLISSQVSDFKFLFMELEF